MTGCEYIGPTTVPIRGYPGYFISLDCTVWSGRNSRHKPLTQFPERKRGYLLVNLILTTAKLGRKHRERQAHVSRLMLSSFVRAPIGDEQADHIDSARITDNTLDNLQWLSPAENLAKRKLPLGKDHWVHKYPEKCLKGVDHTNAKLTKEQVDYCKAKYVLRKYSFNKLGKELGVHPTTVANVVKGKHYK